MVWYIVISWDMHLLLFRASASWARVNTPFEARTLQSPVAPNESTRKSASPPWPPSLLRRPQTDRCLGPRQHVEEKYFRFLLLRHGQVERYLISSRIDGVNRCNPFQEKSRAARINTMEAVWGISPPQGDLAPAVV